MATSYIPAKDADFNSWLTNFSALLTATPLVFGLTAPDAVSVDTVKDAWATAYTAATDPGTRTSATVAAKDAARASAEAVVRPLAVRISLNPSVTEENKIAIGVTVRAFPPSPIPAPVVAPVISHVSSAPGLTRLAFKATGAAGKAKPFGAIGVEIYRSVGTVPAVDPAQATFVGTYTKTPFAQVFMAGDAGKTATFFARFVTRSGPAGVAQAGPWSAPLALIVM